MICNCIISGNATTGHGGGVRCEDGNVTSIRHSTISGNTAGMNGGGVSSAGPSTAADISDSILWADQALNGSEIAVGSSSSLDVAYADVQGGLPAAYLEGAGELNWSDGNINADPLFAVGPTGTWTADGEYDPQTFQTTFTDFQANWGVNELVGSTINPDTTQPLQFAVVANSVNTVTVWADWASIDAGVSWVTAAMDYQIHDYHLTAPSPCIEAGDPAIVSQPGGTDIDGQPRVMGCRVEMGMDEFTAGEPHSGDLDGSGGVDLSDVPIFVSTLLGEGGVFNTIKSSFPC